MGDREMSLGRFISNKRTLMRLTQEELAEKVGVSKSAIAKWETDRGVPDRDNLKKLSEVMRVSVDDLHHIIRLKDTDDVDLKANITPDVIAVLESYGYTVIRPGERRRKNGD